MRTGNSSPFVVQSPLVPNVKMASLTQHNEDCKKFLGESFENVNKWIDEYFTQHGAKHRRFRHHREGIDEARDLFGERGALAAAIHILRDCRHIPREEDYVLGYVDALGLKANWSTASYIKYSEEEFDSLVEQLLKPSGVVLWAYIDQQSVQLLLSSLTRLDPEKISQLTDSWRLAVSIRENIPPLPPAPVIRPIEDQQVLQYVQELQRQNPFFQNIAPGKEVHFGLVPLDELVNPLVLLDYELLDSLKPELPIVDDLHIAQFALPQQIRIPIKVMLDPSMRNAIFVSNDKSLSVGPAQVHQTPIGTAITFMVGASGSALVAANYSGRLILRNGIHRAFLLANKGVKVAPCIIVNETGPIVSSPSLAYPSFSDQVLVLPRPPVVTDFLNQDLTVQVPLQRTHKLVKISAEDTIVPID